MKKKLSYFSHPYLQKLNVQKGLYKKNGKNFFYIQMFFKLGISAKQVHSELKNIDEDAQTIQKVHNWFHLFKKGEKNLKDKRRSGRRSNYGDH